MSVADVASRIQQIQGQIALLSPSTSSPASSAAFAEALAGATSVENSWSTPSTLMLVTEAPGIDESSVRRSELPSV